MKLTIEHRDLFTVPYGYILCHCITADFALGAGIAKKFAELGVRDALLQHYNEPYPYSWGGIGDCLFTEATKWQGEYNLVTKEKCWHKPTERTLRQALTVMLKLCDTDEKIAMPKIGCGLDKMKWETVEQLIREVFEDSDIEILVCDWK